MQTQRLLATFGCPAAIALGADPALTIYNKNFAVIRETLLLDLKTGNNIVRFSGATAQLEPDSVVLRDPANNQVLQVLEQSYRNDPVSQERLLDLYEGKTIEFQTGSGAIVQGRIVRSGYVPHYQAMPRYGRQYQANQTGRESGGSGQPIIEVDGKLRFTLPGMPIFPALADDTILKPTLDWVVYSPQPARVNAELSYISSGMSWKSDYNIVAPETGDTLDLIGWVTLNNQSGKQFDNAHIKLMAGDVNKVQSPNQTDEVFARVMASGVPAVTEKAFEDYHLYSLPHPTTIHDRETKQVEFLRSSGIQSQTLYIYDGARAQRGHKKYQDFRSIPEYGTESDPHVGIMRQFTNSAANHLGVPLPQGRVRFYRRDRDGQLEFTGENEIGHTPKDETICIYTGNAFDLSGERRQTVFNTMGSQPGGYTDESLEIKVRNHKKETVTVLVVEHLSRWSNWEITQSSDPHRKTDSKTIEYTLTLKPDEEKTITYTAHYTW